MGVQNKNSSVSSSFSSGSSGSMKFKLKRLNVGGIENENFVGDGGFPLPLQTKETAIMAENGNCPTDTVIDPWDTSELKDDGPSWSEMTTTDKLKRIALNLFKGVILLGLLYFFICSLDLLGSAFRLLAGEAAADLFHSDIVNNPFAALMIGVLVTVLLQSSSTSTSIIVAMVGSGILDVKTAVPIIMGANIGTSVTSTIVAMSQASDKEIFRRAFAGGTVHDMFNWLTVVVLLPLEVASGYLYESTKAITDSMGNSSAYGAGETQFLQALTRPFTNLIVQVDETAIEQMAAHIKNFTTVLLLKCDEENITDGSGNWSIKDIPCHHLFMNTTLTDMEIGLILLFVSLFIICSSLILLVKLLNGMLRGSVSRIIKKVINYDLPFPFTFLTGYIAILIGAGMTIIVQSSSVFTSTLTPLVGLGVITVERMYPLTLGSNVGTTFTSVLAALASSPATFKSSLQTSLIHFFFNISGVLLWYVVPFMRKVPIAAAKFLGNTTAKYRWFALMYLLFVFLLLPGAIFGLSIASTGGEYLIGFGAPVLVLILFVAVVKVMQKKCPNQLPMQMRTWKWLPKPMRSLEPMDHVMRKILSVWPCCRGITPECTIDDAPTTVLQDPIRNHVTTFSIHSEHPIDKVDLQISLVSTRKLI